MEPRLFDELAQLVDVGLRRRRLGTALLGAIALGFGRPLAVEARCNKVGRRCERKKDCCDHAKCKRGKCRCKNGYKSCSKKCVDLDVDEKHCGGCNTRCAGGERCCNGRCVDLAFSDGNCGGCGNACPATAECVGSACIPLPPGGCPAGGDNCQEGGNSVPCGALGANCRCFQTTEQTTFCAGPPVIGSFCGICDTSADCADFGPTAVCIASTNIDNCCGPSAQNVCALPCPSLG